MTLEQALMGGSKEREPAEKSLSFTSVPLGRPAEGSPAAIRLMRTVLTLTWCPSSGKAERLVQAQASRSRTRTG